MKKKPSKKNYNLDEIANFMDSVELGQEPTIDEMDGIGEYIEELKINSQEDE